MLIQKETNMGHISIHEDVIVEILRDALEVQHGRMWLSTPKGKALQADDEDGWEISEDGEDISIKVFVIVRFGISISSAANQLIDELNERYRAAFGELPASVTVAVTGVKSRKTAKRNLIIRRDQR